nr:transposase [Actinomyces sp. ICM47]
MQVLGVDEHVWHHQDRRRRGPRELTGIVDLTRGEEHPAARLLDLVPGRSGTVYKNWLEERGEDFRAGVQIATLDPFQGQQERHRRSTPRRNQRARCLSHRQARWRRSR